MSRSFTEGDQHEHQRHLNQHSDNGGQGSTRGEAKEHNRSGNGHLKVIGGTNHGGWGSILVLEFKHFCSAIPKGKYEEAYLHQGS